MTATRFDAIRPAKEMLAELRSLLTASATERGRARLHEVAKSIVFYAEWLRDTTRDAAPVHGATESSSPLAAALEAPVVIETRLQAPNRETLDTTEILALGSRVIDKIPQDAAACVLDPSSGARSYVVADGVTACDADPPAVRRFAAAMAARTARQVVANHRRLGAAAACGEGDAQAHLSALLRAAVRTIVATPTGAALRDLPASPAEDSSAPVKPNDTLEGAACVVGGVIWIPRTRHVMLFAVGNITTIGRVTSAEPGSDRVLALSGSLDEQIIVRADAPVVPDVEVMVREVDKATVIDLLVMSDGARGPREPGRFDAPAGSGATDDVFGRWARVAAAILAGRRDFRVALTDAEPADDVTIVAARVGATEDPP